MTPRRRASSGAGDPFGNRQRLPLASAITPAASTDFTYWAPKAPSPPRPTAATWWSGSAVSISWRPYTASVGTEAAGRFSTRRAGTRNL